MTALAAAIEHHRLPIGTKPHIYISQNHGGRLQLANRGQIDAQWFQREKSLSRRQNFDRSADVAQFERAVRSPRPVEMLGEGV